MIGNAIPIENLRRGSADTESPEEFFARKLQILKSISSERTLLIIDNFDTDHDPYLDDLISGPYHLIFTTRNEFEDYPMVKIGKIRDFEKVRQIFTANYGKTLSPADTEIVDQILELVNCHTITVELIAKQMKASRRKPAQMLEMLRSTGVNTQLKEKIKHSSTDAGASSFAYIRQMFQLSGLSEEEKHILCCMCMLPHTGIDISTFSDWCGLESYDEINSLLAKSWLMLDEETDILSIHPVIGDVVRSELAPTPLACRDYVMGLWNVAKKSWYMTVEERADIMPYVAYIQNHFPTPVPELQLQYADFVNVAWICSDFERSQKSGHAHYEFCLAQYGPASVEAGDAARFLAGAYHNGGDNESAEPYYQRALEHYLACPEPDDGVLGTIYSKLGRCAYFEHQYSEALALLDKAMEAKQRLIDRTVDPKLKNLYTYHTGDIIVEYARMYMEQGDYATALPYAEKSYDVFLLMDGTEIPNSAYSLVDMGICSSNLGNFRKAEEYLDRALALNIRFNGQASVQTVRTREAIADNAMRKGDREAARRMYMELELDLEQDFGPANPQVRSIREKRKAAE